MLLDVGDGGRVRAQRGEDGRQLLQPIQRRDGASVAVYIRLY